MIDYWALYIIFSIRVSLNIIASIDLIRFTLPVAFLLTYTLYCLLHNSSSRLLFMRAIVLLFMTCLLLLSALSIPSSIHHIWSSSPYNIILRSLTHTNTHTHTHTQSWLYCQDADWWHSWVFNWERRAISVYKREECTLWQVDCSPYYAHYMT